MSMLLQTQEEAFTLIQQRLDSREWWTILSADETTNALACAIENAFYTGEKSKYFDMILVPRPFEPCLMMALYMATKTLMSRADLAKLTGDSLSAGGDDPDADVLACPTLMGIMAMRWLCANFKS